MFIANRVIFTVVLRNKFKMRKSLLNSACDAVIVLNRAASDANLTLDLSLLPGLTAGEKLSNALTADSYTVSPALTISLTVPALNGVILVNSDKNVYTDGNCIRRETRRKMRQLKLFSRRNQ